MSGSFRFTNSEVLLNNKLEKTSFCFENGIITDYGRIEIDMDGFRDLLGIIDLHGDRFERHLTPRPSAAFNIELGLRSADGESPCNGITTAYFAQEGLCDVSVSDYYYPALSNSIWSLHDYKVMDFAKAWSLISSAPAEALNLKSKGKLDLGYWADFTILEPLQRSIEATLRKGKPHYMAGKLASLILNSRND